MFEKAKPPAIPKAASSSMRGLQDIDASALETTPVGEQAVGEQAVGEHVEAIPLRTIEWSELTARLSAARDFRRLLRHESHARSSEDELGFADAAAQFFRTSEDDERGVNLTALEGRKASSGMYQTVKSKGAQHVPFATNDCAEAATQMRVEPGDAREEQ